MSSGIETVLAYIDTGSEHPDNARVKLNQFQQFLQAKEQAILQGIGDLSMQPGAASVR